MKNKAIFIFLMLVAFGLGACVSGKPLPSDNAGAGMERTKPMPAEPTAVTSDPASNVMDCYVKVWEGKDFTGATAAMRPEDLRYGEFPNIKKMSEGMRSGWGQNVESLEVGKCATALVFTGKNFSGSQKSFDSGAAAGNLKQFNLGDINSMKVTCTCSN